MTSDERYRAAAEDIEADCQCSEHIEANLRRHFPPVDIEALARELAWAEPALTDIFIKIINKHIGAGRQSTESGEGREAPLNGQSDVCQEPVTQKRTTEKCAAMTDPVAALAAKIVNTVRMYPHMGPATLTKVIEQDELAPLRRVVEAAKEVGNGHWMEHSIWPDESCRPECPRCAQLRALADALAGLEKDEAP